MSGNEKESGSSSTAENCCFKVLSTQSSLSAGDMSEDEIAESNLMNGEMVNNNRRFYDANCAATFPIRNHMDLTFEDIRYSVKEWTFRKPIPVNKEILSGVSGKFSAGELTAIMGPSGAGKSTLLNVLAGYIVTGSSGNVIVNGEPRKLEKFGRQSCYILQDDCPRKQLTASEAMLYACDLKLGLQLAKEKKIELTKKILSMLGLSSCWNTPSARMSGGQKKRLSIALELVSNPPIIFLDEPTTGLDSMSCSQCISLLKLLAQQGRTVVCTIHQPSSLLFEMFDNLYAIAAGRCIYSGKVRDLVPHLANFGLDCPKYHNPADFLIDVAVGDYGADIEKLTLSAKKQITYSLNNTSSSEVVSGLNNNQYSRIDKEDTSTTKSDSVLDLAPPSFLAQTYILFCRKLLIVRRSPTMASLRVFAHLIIALMVGYVYRDSGHSAEATLGNYCFLYGSNLFVVYTGKMSSTLLFPLELPSVEREYFNRWYKLLPYYVSTMMWELPLQLLCCVAYLPIAYYWTDEPQAWNRFWLMMGSLIMVSLTSQGFGFLLGIVATQKIAVFIGPILACLISVSGFCMRYIDTPDAFKAFYHISYFRASFQNSVHAIFGLNRERLECGRDDGFCVFELPYRFLKEMDLLQVNIGVNFAYITFCGILFHALTIVVLWLRFNKR